MRLNQTEATALIASQLQEHIRDGKYSVAELMQLGKTILGIRHVLPHVPSLLRDLQVEGTFEDGCVFPGRSRTLPHWRKLILLTCSVFLVTVLDPICTQNGNLEAALYGSFLPISSEDVFPVLEASEYSHEKAPGAVIARKERIVINQGRDRTRIRVTNNGDRPVQVSIFRPVCCLFHYHPDNSDNIHVGSHYHFIETNAALVFDRGKAYGKYLDIAAGTAVRFEPGETKTVTLCAIAGGKIISGGNSLASGVFDPDRTNEIIRQLVQKGFGHRPESIDPGPPEATTIGREDYIAMYARL